MLDEIYEPVSRTSTFKCVQYITAGGHNVLYSAALLNVSAAWFLVADAERERQNNSSVSRSPEKN